MLKNIVEHDYLPDYTLELNSDTDVIKFKNRNKMPKAIPKETEGGYPKVRPETMDKAKKAAPRYDVYVLLQEWHAFWHERGRQPLENPDAAFIGFCKNRYKRNSNI